MLGSPRPLVLFVLQLPSRWLPSLLLVPPADLLPREAQFVVTIGNVRGVPDTSVLDPEPGPQGPFITYSYYVTYDFVEDEEDEGKKYGGVLAEVCAFPENMGASTWGSMGSPVQAEQLLGDQEIP